MNEEKQLLKTVDAEALLATPLKAARFVVDQLIPQGLHILAGSPKIGKSRLAIMENADTPYNTITKLINQFHNTVLFGNGITYEYRRDGGKRYISLEYKADNDGYDSNDSDVPTEKELSQPSQLSQNVAENGSVLSHV